MKTIGYIRISTDKQDAQKQEHLLLRYAQQHDLHIDRFVSVEMSSRKSTRERRIDDLLHELTAGDTLVVAELSRLGRNMFEVIEIINQLGQRGAEIFLCDSLNCPLLGHTANYSWLFTAILLKQSGSLFHYVPNKGWQQPAPKGSNWDGQRGAEISIGRLIPIA